MYYKITNGSVSFGADVVLENIDFEIKDREKIAVVGRNGCGKTTLLKVVAGEIIPEAGTGESGFSVTKAGNPVIGYLKQMAFEDENATLRDEVMKVFAPIFAVESKMEALLKRLGDSADEKTVNSYSAACEKFEFLGGYTYKKEYAVMVKSFGFGEEDENRRISEFSGGQRTRIALMKLLLSKPDILLLDEPTNHLDVMTVRWLEDYLKNYKSAVVIVSHDRMFINRIVDKVYEIEYGETRCYKGNYSDFERIKRENYEKQLKDHELFRAETERIKRVIERFRYKATKAKMVQSKIKYLERMQQADAPHKYDLKTFHADFQPQFKSASETLEVKGLKIGYDVPLAENINFKLYRGEKLGVIGANGTGKSTLLKTLTGKIRPLGGIFYFGANVKIGYFDQQMTQFNREGTVMDYFHDKYPALTEFEVRSALGAFMFSGEDVFKNITDLSGGEKVRLALCTILKERPNVLILDEPTNHMDIVGKETLENMLSAYEGTLVFVSHDRYFVKKIADKLLVFENGAVNFYPFGYDEYDELCRAEESDKTTEREKTTSLAKETTVNKSAKKYCSPLKEKGKIARKIQKLEKLIADTEKEINSYNEKLLLPEVYTDYIKSEKIQSEIERLTALCEEFTAEWLALSESSE